MARPSPRAVASMLSHQLLDGIDFSFRGLQVSRANIGRVATEVRLGNILIRPLAATGAEYQSLDNIMFLPDMPTRAQASAQGVDVRTLGYRYEALVIHEAVHAWADIRYWNEDNAGEEALAYLTQVAYLRARHPEDDLRGMEVPRIFEEARALLDAGVRGTISGRQLASLRQAVTESEPYRRAVACRTRHDGVRRIRR